MGVPGTDVRIVDTDGTPWRIILGRGQVDVISLPTVTVNPNITATFTNLTTATAGKKQLLAAPGTNLSYQLRYVHINNGGASTVTAALRQGSTGGDMFKAQLASTGGQWNANLIATYRQLSANTSLFVTLSGAVKVNFTIGYKVV